MRKVRSISDATVFCPLAECVHGHVAEMLRSEWSFAYQDLTLHP